MKCNLWGVAVIWRMREQVMNSSSAGRNRTPNVDELGIVSPESCGVVSGVDEKGASEHIVSVRENRLPTPIAALGDMVWTISNDIAREAGHARMADCTINSQISALSP